MYPLVMTNIAIEAMAHRKNEIVDLFLKDGDFPVRYVCLPEGIDLRIFKWESSQTKPILTPIAYCWGILADPSFEVSNVGRDR